MKNFNPTVEIDLVVESYDEFLDDDWMNKSWDDFQVQLDLD